MTLAWDPSRFAHPWFARVADLVARFTAERDWPSIARLNDVFAAELATVGVRLVEAAKTKPALAVDGTIDPRSLYEVRIADTGDIPTRARNAHDLLNALVWAAFPHSKLALSRALATVQRARAAGRATLPPTRTRDHDRLALVDEGALLCIGDTQWIFGHALYEHAYAGNDTVRGSAVDLGTALAGRIAGLDVQSARAVIDRALAAADLARVVRPGPGVAITSV